MLERQRVRNDAIARLVDASTAAGANVFRSRVTPLASDELPALVVYTLEERGNDLGGMHMPMFKTTITLQIDATVSGVDGWDDALDSLCEQVEAALLSDADFVRQFDNVSALSTTIKYEDGGEYPQAGAVISIDLQYLNEFQPLVDDDLEETHIDVDAIDPADPNTGNEGYAGGSPGPDGRNEAVMVIEHET